MNTSTRLTVSLLLVFCLTDLRTAPGDIVEIVTDFKNDLSCNADNSLMICNLYARFDTLDQSLFLVDEANIVTDDPQGFHQVPSSMGGTNTAPNELFLIVFPELACDSFVTIGLKSVPVGMPDGTTTVYFDYAAFNTKGALYGDWFNNNPTDWTQGFPDPETTQVLFAQLTVRSGYNVFGNSVDLHIWEGDSFFVFSDFQCVSTVCVADVTGDGHVNAADLALVIGSWGPCGDCGECTADLNGDCVVNAADLALVIGSWGPC